MNAHNVLGAVRIDSSILHFVSQEELEHFFEWRPNSSIVYDEPWLSDTIVAYTNDDGIIGDINYAIPKPKGVFRIVAIGDSFTEGPFVINGNTYPKILENRLNHALHCPDVVRYEILNFGVKLYDLEYAAHRFIKKGITYGPDLVLWLVKDDDFEEFVDNALEKTQIYLEYIDTTLGGDITRWDGYSFVPEDLKSKDTDLWSKVYYAVREELNQQMTEQEKLEVHSQALRHVAMATASPIMLVTFRNINTTYKSRMRLWEKIYDNVSVIELDQDMYSEETSFMPYDAHPNEAGYKTIAEGIYQALNEDIICLPKEGGGLHF